MTGHSDDALALLSVAEMYVADAAAAAAGISGERLMEAAGRAVADAVAERWSARALLVLCGPGNNGGDGFVAARLLEEAGWPVTVALLGPREALRGDAVVNAGRWEGPMVPLATADIAEAGLVIDAMFGAGLTRPLEGDARTIVEDIAARRIHCVAVDVPSGVHGDSGQVMGTALHADVTVTFFRRKPGHVLLPGRWVCGDVVVADIGIPEDVLPAIAPLTYANAPSLWRDAFPWPRIDGHKYTRGHAVIAGGAMTGAARLVARGALRCGAGLVSIACTPELAPIYAHDRPGIIIRPTSDLSAFGELITDPRVTSMVIGPGHGVDAATRSRAQAALATGKPCVLDADALTVFAGDSDALCHAIAGPCVLTPHEGEYARLFTESGDKPARARAAAARTGAVVVLKGPDTVIADPVGRAVISENAPPTLATAGAGDVLVGLVAALLAQGMPAFEAACAAVWLHGDAATRFGPGLIAEDLPEMMPAVLRGLDPAAAD